MKILKVNKINKKSQVFLIGIITLLILAIYLSFTGGYGADEDTLPMIYVFETKLASGEFVTSRFTGNPVAEIGIGFLAYFFGSWAANLVTFFLFFFGLLLFYFSFEKKNKEKVLLFLLICLSSPILFFDNLEPVDYSWAFFFYSLGLILFKKNFTEASIIFFALAVGVRINYFLFIFFTLLFFDNSQISLKRRLVIIVCVFFTGCLFYLPVWYDSQFQLHWLTAGRPTDEGTLGLITRFIYKSFYAFGGLASFLLIYSFIKDYRFIKKDKNKNFFLYLSLSNILLFLWLPAELSYLQLAIILIYFVVSTYGSSKLIYLIVFIHFFTWIINPQFITIKYKPMQEVCSVKHAIDAKINFHFEEGYFYNFLNTRNFVDCAAPGDGERNKRIRSGLSIKK